MGNPEDDIRLSISVFLLAVAQALTSPAEAAFNGLELPWCQPSTAFHSYAAAESAIGLSLSLTTQNALRQIYAFREVRQLISPQDEKDVCVSALPLGRNEKDFFYYLVTIETHSRTNKIEPTLAMQFFFQAAPPQAYENLEPKPWFAISHTELINSVRPFFAVAKAEQLTSNLSALPKTSDEIIAILRVVHNLKASLSFDPESIGLVHLPGLEDGVESYFLSGTTIGNRAHGVYETHIAMLQFRSVGIEAENIQISPLLLMADGAGEPTAVTGVGQVVINLRELRAKSAGVAEYAYQKKSAPEYQIFRHDYLFELSQLAPNFSLQR